MSVKPRTTPDLPKRYLTTAEACHVYGTSPDFLERVSVADLPRSRRGHRTVLYDVADLEMFFAKYRVAGDESGQRRDRQPTVLPVVAHVGQPSEAA